VVRGFAKRFKPPSRRRPLKVKYSKIIIKTQNFQQIAGPGGEAFCEKN
jgi:hypothetical protein